MNYFNYFTDIENAFIRRRGRHLSLSPLDWALMESWQEKEIPLRIVLRGIDMVFDNIAHDPKRLKSIKSISFCKDQVESLHDEWLAANVGKVENTESQKAEKSHNVKTESESNITKNNSVLNHVENVICELENSKAKTSGDLRQTLEQIIKRLKSFKKNDKQIENLEDSLDQMDKLLDETLMNNIDDKLLVEMKTEIEKELAKHKTKMDTDAYQSTFNLMLYKRLRENSGIPRLSLFNL